jgi:hypothetical protein
MKPVQFSPLASREVASTADEYEEKAPGLGEKFISEVEAATSTGIAGEGNRDIGEGSK